MTKAELKFYRIDESDKGIFQTVEVMNSLIEAGAALPLFQNLRYKPFTIEDYFNYCRDQIAYKNDPVGIEYVRRADHTIRIGHGDCDDKVIALCTMLKAAKPELKLKIVVGACDRFSNEFSHVWAEMYQNGEWISIDPTPKRSVIGFRPRASRTKDFFIN